MTSTPSDDTILSQLGAALARVRLRRNQTQSELAHQAGVSRATVHRLESGQSTQLTNLVRILRALGLEANLASFLPSATMQPLEQLHKEQGTPRRQRARRKPTDDDKPWHWGPDE